VTTALEAQTHRTEREPNRSCQDALATAVVGNSSSYRIMNKSFFH